MNIFSAEKSGNSIYSTFIFKASIPYALVCSLCVLLGLVIANYLIQRDFASKWLMQTPIWILVSLFVLLVSVFSAAITKRFPNIEEIVKFLYIGVLNTALDFSIFNFLLSMNDNLTNLVTACFASFAFLVANVNSYFWNSLWTFSGSNSSLSFIRYRKFFLISVVGIILNWFVVYGLLTFPQYIFPIIIWSNLSKLIATAVNLVWNFLWYKRIVFNQ